MYARHVGVSLWTVWAGLALLTPPRVASGQESKTSTVDLVQVQLIVPARITAGKTFIVVDELENAGEHPALDTLTGFCLSVDEVCDERDLRLGARRVPALKAQESHSMQTPIKMPANVPPGEYHLIAIADATRVLEERYRSNNVRAVRTRVLAAR